ncbi:MAG: phosphomannomutase/phosphoglucomutase [Candidatus Woesearchaeota archaeon]
MGIFHAYDIRGKHADFSSEVVQHIARGFFDVMQPHTVVVGRDMRSSSEFIAQTLIQTLKDCGVHVIDIGVCSTPMSYFANVHYKADGSLMVTASHNDASFNGIKVCAKDAVSLSYEDGLQHIEQYTGTPEKKQGSVEQKNIHSSYIRFFIERLRMEQPLRIVVDCANGMGGLDMALFAENTLDISYIPLYWELDGSFPHHEANPVKPENIRYVQEQVKQHPVDFGCAFDGDADRIVFVDEQGTVIGADILLAFLADTLKPKKVIVDLRASMCLEDVTSVVRSRVGHSYIQKEMIHHKAQLGGELSGHYYFKDFYYADCALFTLLHVVNILSNSGKPLSELVAPYQRYVQSGEHNFKVKDPSKLIEAIEHTYKGDTSIDGVLCKQEGYWFVVRKSNTEPLVRLTMEADSKHILDEAFAQVQKYITSFEQ